MHDMLQKMVEANLEEVLGVKQAGVDLGGRLVAQADHEDLGRGVSRGCRLCCLHLLKQLLEGVQQRIVVLGPAHSMALFLAAITRLQDYGIKEYSS